MDITNLQLGVWLACLGAFILLSTGILTTFRLLTRNFVTEERLKNSLLQMERGIEKGIDNTRHAIRNEFTSAFMKIDERLGDIKDDHTIFRESLARIEGCLSIEKKSQ